MDEIGYHITVLLFLFFLPSKVKLFIASEGWVRGLSTTVIDEGNFNLNLNKFIVYLLTVFKTFYIIIILG